MEVYRYGIRDKTHDTRTIEEEEKKTGKKIKNSFLLKIT